MCECCDAEHPAQNGPHDHEHAHEHAHPHEHAPGQEHDHAHSHEHAQGTDRVREEWEKVRRRCEEFRHEATEHLEKARQTTLGDLLDGALEGVKRRPGLGLLTAAALGFCLGRLFRR